MDIGLFGGAFNPPHLAHLVVAEAARVHCQLDHVLWIPTHIPPHKSPDAFASTADRLEMVRLAIETNPGFRLSDVEVRRSDTSYTIETVKILKNEYPNATLWLILGGDSLETFDTWYHFEKLLQEVRLIAFDRPGCDYGAVDQRILDAALIIPDTPGLQISSSQIRRRIANGKSVRYLVPESVDQYIRRRKLYRASS